MIHPPKQILILGANGNAGRQIAGLLLKHQPNITLFLGGRNSEKLELLKQQLDEKFPQGQIYSKVIDVKDKQLLIEALGDIDLIVVSTSFHQYSANVMDAALASNTNYFDIQLSSCGKHQLLEARNELIIKNQLIFITDGGFHPGILGTMAVYASQKMSDIESIQFYGLLSLDWQSIKISEETRLEFLDEMLEFKNEVYEDGGWKKNSWWKTVNYDFKSPYGMKACMPYGMKELKFLPEKIKSLKTTGFFITGFNTLTDYFILPFVYLGCKLLPTNFHGMLANLLKWGMDRSKPPYGVRIEMIAKNKETQMNMKVSNPDAYLLTAAPAVACILQLLDGEIKTPGIHFQAYAVQPDRFIADMKKMNIKIKAK